MSVSPSARQSIEELLRWTRLHPNPALQRLAEDLSFCSECDSRCPGIHRCPERARRAQRRSAA